jgi:nucleoside-diphosphate-sugar epimerase
VNILITGAAGFIGSHLVESQLRQGHQVRALDLHLGQLRVAAPQARLEVIQGDIRDAKLVERSVAGIDIVYHLASAHLDVSLARSDYWQINVEAATGLLAAARAAGVHRVVHCSSVGVMGDILHPPGDELTPLQPTNLYESTKLAGENVVRQFAAQTGFSVIVVRPAWVYGPRCPRTAKLLRAIRRGRFVVFGNGRTLRHPLYVADAVVGLERCASVASAPGEVYILAGEHPVSVGELVRTAAEVLAVPPPRLRLPIGLGLLAGYTLQGAFKLLGKSPPFSRRSMDFFLKDNAYDTRKAQHDLGFRPRVDLRSGLDASWRWLNNRPAEISETERHSSVQA